MVLRLEKHWGSQTPDYRLSLRRQILAEFGGENTLDLSVPPKVDKGFVSLSHSKELGGFAWSSKSPIGFDIEKSGRGKEPTLARVSNEREIKNAPTLTHLWCAKEAAYKSLYGFNQPKVISDIEIIWNKDGEFSLLFEGEEFGNGNAWIERDHTLAVFEHAMA